jgi:hypothetical protein
MPRQGNPYSGTYAPARISLTKEDLVKGIKGLKIRAPNRKMSTAGYKSGIPKEHQEQE